MTKGTDLPQGCNFLACRGWAVFGADSTVALGGWWPWELTWVHVELRVGDPRGSNSAQSLLSWEGPPRRWPEAADKVVCSFVTLQ